MAEWGDGKTGVPRPAGIPKALNTKAVYFALALQADPAPDATVQDGMKRMLGTIQEDQIENGSRAAWPATPPPVFGPFRDRMTGRAPLAPGPAPAPGGRPA